MSQRLRSPTHDTLFDLRVFIKGYAEAARQCRRHESKAKGLMRETLHNFRVVEIRERARVAQLAYAFVRGKPCPEREEPPVRIKIKVWSLLRVHPAKQEEYAALYLPALACLRTTARGTPSAPRREPGMVGRVAVAALYGGVFGAAGYFLGHLAWWFMFAS